MNHKRLTTIRHKKQKNHKVNVNTIWNTGQERKENNNKNKNVNLNLSKTTG